MGQWTAALWQRITQPDHTITDTDAQRRARLISGLVFGCAILAVIGLIFGAPLLPVSLLLIACYGFSRTVYYEVAATLALMAFSLPSHLIILTHTGTFEGFYVFLVLIWLALPITLSGLILRWPGMLAVMSLNVIVALSQRIHNPDIPIYELQATVAFLFALSTLVFLSSLVQRRYLIQTRIDELKQKEIELQRINHDLEAANREVRDFAYIVAHDLRAPLVNIDGFMKEIRYCIADIAPVVGLDHLGDKQHQLARNTLYTDLPEALDYVDIATNKMDHMISSILALSRAGRRESHPQQLNIHDMVASIADSLAGYSACIEVGDLPDVVADAEDIEQIFDNLLDNAVKYLDPARPGAINVTGQRNGHEVVYHVRDNGRGIAETDFEKVFQLFRRAANTGSIPGDGMGLPYVKTLVQRQGGRVWFTSQEGVGTTFSFTVPIKVETSS